MSEDAFEKLAKLAGVSVEPTGDGLPRTRAEALALGATLYFTGNPCKHGHIDKRSAKSKNCYECERIRVRELRASPRGKEYLRQYSAKPETKALKKSPGAIQRSNDRQRRYDVTPKGKEARRRNRLKLAGDAIIFAIGQASWAASRGRAPADIVTQCQEPQRSQLQALVDRIKADPLAGKSVIGLLLNMREIRKLELAEMAQATETETEN